MSKDQDAKFDAILDTMHDILKRIDENSKATQSQIDEIKTVFYTLEERVTKLEKKPSSRNTYHLPDDAKNEIKQIVREVMREKGAVLQRKEYGIVLDKSKVYARCGQHGYTHHQVLKGLNEAGILITDNDGHSCRVVWDGNNQKAFRAIVIALNA